LGLSEVFLGDGLILNGDSSADLGFLKDDGDGVGVGADASVGGVTAVYIAFVHADAGAGEAHPVRHAGSEELTSSGGGVLPRVGVTFYDAAAGIEDFSIEIRALVFDLLGDSEVASGGSVSGASGGDAVVHGDLVSDHEEASLGGEIDFNTGVTRGCGR